MEAPARYATQALTQMLLEIRELGLPHIDITTDPDNLPSQRVIRPTVACSWKRSPSRRRSATMPGFCIGSRSPEHEKSQRLK